MIIPERKKTGRDVSMLRTGAFIPKKKKRIAAMAKSEPLKGLPDIQARAETEISGRQRRTDKVLPDGFHFKISAAKRI
jgi:hypothetical protein